MGRFKRIRSSSDVEINVIEEKIVDIPFARVVMLDGVYKVRTRAKKSFHELVESLVPVMEVYLSCYQHEENFVGADPRDVAKTFLLNFFRQSGFLSDAFFTETIDYIEGEFYTSLENPTPSVQTGPSLIVHVQSPLDEYGLSAGDFLLWAGVYEEDECEDRISLAWTKNIDKISKAYEKLAEDVSLDLSEVERKVEDLINEKMEELV